MPTLRIGIDPSAELTHKNNVFERTWIRGHDKLLSKPVRVEGVELPARAEGIEHFSNKVSQTLVDKLLRKKYNAKGSMAREKLGIPPEHTAVLSIDGGGVRGLIPLALLTSLETTHGAKCCEIFDVILGTSTGAIIGSLLASGMPAQDIQKFYQDEIHTIFKLDRDGEQPEPYKPEYFVDLKPPGQATIEAIGDLAELAIKIATGRDIEIPDGVSGSAVIKAGTWAKHLAANTFSTIQSDRTLRLVGGSPIYSKTPLSEKLKKILGARFPTMGDLARANECILVFAAVDSKNGATVFMSATGREGAPGTCEHALTASCVEASASAPLYFNAFGDPGTQLVDGGTLGFNMPLLGGLIHLEHVYQIRLDVPGMLPKRGKRPAKGASKREVQEAIKVQEAISNFVFQPFDLNETTILSFGCGVPVIKPLDRAVVDCSHAQMRYGEDRWPYGEISKAFDALDLKAGNVIANLVLGTAVFGPVLGLGFSGLTTVVDKLKELVENMGETLDQNRRFGVGAAINALTFVREGLGRDAWTVQEDVFRSRLYRGDFRRFQLSLDRDMQCEGLWEYRTSSKSPSKLANSTPRYQMPFKVKFGDRTIKGGAYDLVSIWTELEDRKMKDFVPGLEPLGTLSLQWLQAIGERFADAVDDFTKSKKGADAEPFTIDLVDNAGQDVFVSSNARNYVSEGRWKDLLEMLKKER